MRTSFVKTCNGSVHVVRTVHLKPKESQNYNPYAVSLFDFVSLPSGTVKAYDCIVVPVLEQRWEDPVVRRPTESCVVHPPISRSEERLGLQRVPQRVPEPLASDPRQCQDSLDLPSSRSVSKMMRMMKLTYGGPCSMRRYGCCCYCFSSRLF